MLLEATATFEKDIDIEEMFDDLFHYDPDVFTWADGYEEVIEYYADDARMVLKQNKAVVLKACIDLYTKRLQEYRDKELEADI